MPRVYKLPVELYDDAVLYSNECSNTALDMDEYIREIGFPSCKYVRTADANYWEFSEYDMVWFCLRWMHE